jgi:hypothetical protein
MMFAGRAIVGCGIGIGNRPSRSYPDSRIYDAVVIFGRGWPGQAGQAWP